MFKTKISKNYDNIILIVPSYLDKIVNQNIIEEICDIHIH